MNSTVETILFYTIAAGLLSIVYGYFTGKNILNQTYIYNSQKIYLILQTLQ